MGIYTIPTENAMQTTLASNLASGETGSLVLADDWSAQFTGVTSDNPGLIVIDHMDADGVVTPSNREYIKFESISGTTVSTLTRGLAGSIDQSHSAGAIVQVTNDVSVMQSFADALAGVATLDGTETLTNKTLTSPVLDTEVSGTAFLDEDDMDSDSDTKVASQQSIKAYVDASGVLTTTHYAPEGFMINGKIVPSVTSNNLTVAIKGMDGNDPSASNPVYVKIGGTVRTITSALSVTANAGTNYFGCGQTETLGTYEVDFFVYLGWNVTGDNIMLAFSRLPGIGSVGEFTLNNTSDRGWQPAGDTDSTTSDSVVNVGRFAATLSTGAGYTWSVPTFTSTNLIQHPISHTRKLSFKTMITGYSSYSVEIGYYIIDNSKCTISVATNGTSNASGRGIYLPFDFAHYREAMCLNGSYTTNGTTSYALSFVNNASSTEVSTILKYDGTTVPSTGTIIIAIGGTYAI